MKHILSIGQFSRRDIETIFDSISSLDYYPKDIFKGKKLATLFFEPSTRTRLSFEVAFTELGGSVVSVENAFDNSSNAKGESFLDTVKTISQYVDFIVFRHPGTNSAEEAANVANCHLINAGDGAGEHPTQALIDLFTIERYKPLDNLKVSIIGDINYARTIHSFTRALNKFNGVDIFNFDNFKGHKISDKDKAYFYDSDVIYMTRNQTERHNLVSVPSFDYLDLTYINKNAIVLHPLPRGNELDIRFDADPRAKYWEQVKNGVIVRKALLQYIFNA